MSTTNIDLVCFGELLWDMLPMGKVLGGAPFNIVNRANAFGLKAYVISSIGDDDLGEELIDVVRKKGNSINYIQRHKTLPTSTVNILVGKGGEPSYEIVHPVAWDDIVINEKIVELVKNTRTFVYSSLGLRDKRARTALFSLLPHAQLKICDINLRDGHYVKETIMRMVEAADILRMNETELDMIAEWTEITHLSRREQLKALTDFYQYEMVITTLGGEGALCYHKKTWYEQPVFKVKVKDTVGAGDAFLASFITQYIKNQPIESCLSYACAVGGLTAAKHGGTPDISTAEIENLLSAV